jgi:hypothetical protein
MSQIETKQQDELNVKERLWLKKRLTVHQDQQKRYMSAISARINHGNWKLLVDPSQLAPICKRRLRRFDEIFRASRSTGRFVGKYRMIRYKE